MSVCDNKILIEKLTTSPLDNDTEIHVTVLSNLTACTAVNTRDFAFTTAVPGTARSFNEYLRPHDEFQCLPEGCVNSGTLQVTGGIGATVWAGTTISTDATKFVAGILTFFTYLRAPGTQTIRVSISDFEDPGFNDADIYEYEATALLAGFVPIAIDLAEAPSSITGSGWSDSDLGINIRIEVDPVSTGTQGYAYLSSLRIFNSLLDFRVNETVIMGCVENITGDNTVDVTTSTCFGASVDENSASFDRDVLARAITPNWNILSPMMRRGEATEGSIPKTVQLRVRETVRDGKTFGMVRITNINPDECRFLYAQLADSCDVKDSQKFLSSSPVAISITPTDFIRLSGINTPAVDQGVLLFHESLIGEEVRISYPKKVSVSEWIADGRDANRRRTNVMVVRKVKGEIEMIDTYSNVIVTSFPDTNTRDETDFNLAFSVQRDRDGEFFKRHFTEV